MSAVQFQLNTDQHKEATSTRTIAQNNIRMLIHRIDVCFHFCWSARVRCERPPQGANKTSKMAPTSMPKPPQWVPYERTIRTQFEAECCIKCWYQCWPIWAPKWEPTWSRKSIKNRRRSRMAPPRASREPFWSQYGFQGSFSHLWHPSGPHNHTATAVKP